MSCTFSPFFDLFHTKKIPSKPQCVPFGLVDNMENFSNYHFTLRLVGAVCIFGMSALVCHIPEIKIYLATGRCSAQTWRVDMEVGFDQG